MKFQFRLPNARAFALFLALLVSSHSFAFHIHDLVRSGKFKEVKKCITKKPKLANQQDEFGNTPLHIAAATGHSDIMGLLLDLGANPDAKNKKGLTPEELAASKGMGAIAAFLKAVKFEPLLGGAPLQVDLPEDEHLAAAHEAYEESLKVRSQAEEKHSQNAVVTREKKEVEHLKKSIVSALSSPFFGDKHRPFLMKCFSRLLELHSSPPACMLCERPGLKIAGSHWVSDCILSFLSDHWSMPGSNKVWSAGKMTLPLFCTNSKVGDLRCEQLLSKFGEDDFGKFFLPFLKGVLDDAANDVRNIHSIDYDSWLFHCISSLAFRVFISDLERPENWTTKVENDFLLRSAHESIWKFFNDLRDYLLGKAPKPAFRVKLYLSKDGLLRSNELPLAHAIGSSHAKQWHHWVLFSLCGFHFMVFSDELAEDELKEALVLPRGAFVTDIDPIKGRIEILPSHKAILPQLVRGELEAYTQNWVEEYGSFNPQVVHEAASKIKSKGLSFDVSGLIRAARFIVKLPDFLRFIPPAKEAFWKPGRVLASTDAVVPIGFRADPKGKTACWLFRHTKANYDFAIIQVGTDDHELVAAHEFDLATFTPELFWEAALSEDFSPISSLIKLLGTTDEVGYEFSDPDGPAMIIGAALIPHIMKRLNQPGEFSEEDELKAVAESIAGIERVKLRSGEVVGCTVVPAAPDGNCGFTSFGLSRNKFIKDALEAFHSGLDPELNSWIQAAIDELKAENPKLWKQYAGSMSDIEIWATIFQNPGKWMSFLHMKIASRLYRLRISIYILPPQHLLPHDLPGDTFIPLPDAQQHLIDESMVDDPEELHIAWVAMKAMQENQLVGLNHFNQILLNEPLGGQIPTDFTVVDADEPEIPAPDLTPGNQMPAAAIAAMLGFAHFKISK